MNKFLIPLGLLGTFLLGDALATNRVRKDCTNYFKGSEFKKTFDGMLTEFETAILTSYQQQIKENVL